MFGRKDGLAVFSSLLTELCSRAKAACISLLPFVQNYAV